jgi:predicted lipoprotein with Yx(FWY)xxD motif
MLKLRTSRFPKIALLAAALTVAALAVGGVAGASTSKRVVKSTPNRKLGKTVLTNLSGLTLYSLSAEKNGKFICKGSCLRDWHPLYVAAGTKPTGPTKLSAIARPDNGKRQVTAHGLPLYTFDEDERKGDAKGEGIKDVGTWHAATP